MEALTESQRVSLETLAHALLSSPDQATFDERVALLVTYVDGMVANAVAEARLAMQPGPVASEVIEGIQGVDD